MFKYVTDTSVLIDGKKHIVKMENGMTGIGSRQFCVDSKQYMYGAVTQSDDLGKGNHFLYLIKWRDTPWDKVYIFIHEDEVDTILHESQEWRKPIKITV